MRIRAKLCPEHTHTLAALLGEAKGAVVAMPELLPSMVLEARALGVVAFIVEKGTAVSHGAILAKSFGIPTVRVASLEAVRPFSGETVLVDAEDGEILTRPAEDALARLTPLREQVTPVLETLDQWQLVQRLVQQAVDSLARERFPFQWRFLQGLLIETPSAAWGFHRFLRFIDFTSVGTPMTSCSTCSRSSATRPL